MALHRDIHWIGRQWAVTGYGMQAIDQRHGGRFDIEIARLWDEDLLDRLSEQKWFNADDFGNGLAIARRRYPEPPRAVEPELEPEAAPAPRLSPDTPPLQASDVIAPPSAPVPELPSEGIQSKPVARAPEPSELTDEPPGSSILQMPIPGRARFVRPWRVQVQSVQSYRL